MFKQERDIIMATTRAFLTEDRSVHKGLVHTIEHAIPLLGRFLLSFIFLLSAVGKLSQFNGTAQMMEGKGMLLAPFFLVMAILFELIGGLSILLGYKARIGALMLIVFLIPATLIFHNFWAYTGGEHMAQMTNFLKNLAIMGGLLQIVPHGPGALSLGRKE
jgi:putative oxidoreductase